MKTLSLPRIAAVVTAAATVVLVGCIKSDAKTTLNKDGSGVLTERMEMDLTKMKPLMDMVQEMAKGFGGEPGMDGAAMAEPAAPMDPTSTFKEMEAKMRKVEGLTVKEFTTAATDTKITAAFTVEFKEWSLLGKGGALTSGVELAKNADDTYTITLDPSGGQMGNQGAGGGGGGPDAAAILPMFEQFLGTMEVASTLTVPGTITETNGTKSEDGSSVSWKFGFKDLTAGKPITQKVTFKGEGLELKPFKFTPNPEEMMDFMGKKPAKPAGGDAPPPTPIKPEGEKPDPK